jgi:uncharacterized protein
MTTNTQAQAFIGFGQVRHTRLRPARNAFAYATYFLMLPMRSLNRQPADGDPTLAINRFAPISFYDRDHGDARTPQKGGALGWLDDLLAAQGIEDATGEAWLHCYPRVWGYTFKPVSFWFCHRAPDDQGGALRVIVVEVNNTFGERHFYVLDGAKYGEEIAASKAFHVSPFCAVEGGYRFRFMRTSPGAGTHSAARTVARIDYDDAVGPLIQTSVSGVLEPITTAALRKAMWRYPAMTFGVVFHIHLQAAVLWFKRVKFWRKPAPPDSLVTRSL